MPRNTSTHRRKGTAESDQVTPGRHRTLLQLLSALGGSASKLDFQKVLFLYCEEPDSGRPYEFVPYKFGAFSFTSYADLRKLVAGGLIAEEDGCWQLTREGRRFTGANPGLLLVPFIERLEGLSGDALLADTYRRFPYYATRSEIADRVLKGDDEALSRIASEKQDVEAMPLQTVGYEGRTLESYLNMLLQAGVTLLCDVRRNPISRKYGFAKSTLSNACNGVGIRYEHLPELGISSERRQGLETQEAYDALFEEYRLVSLPSQTEALNLIQSWIAGGERVALTCFERLPHQCHRHCVSDALQAMFDSHLEVGHL